MALRAISKTVKMNRGSIFPKLPEKVYSSGLIVWYSDMIKISERNYAKSSSFSSLNLLSFAIFAFFLFCSHKKTFSDENNTYDDFLRQIFQIPSQNNRAAWMDYFLRSWKKYIPIYKKVYNTKYTHKRIIDILQSMKWN